MKTENHEMSLWRIRRVMEREPALTAHGYAVPHPGPQNEDEANFLKTRYDMLTDRSIAQFERAVVWLGLQRRNMHVNPRAENSYGLKHAVERYFKQKYPDKDPYVSNGMFIVAAIDQGFMVKREGWSPNALLNIGLPLNMGEHGQ